MFAPSHTWDDSRLVAHYSKHLAPHIEVWVHHDPVHTSYSSGDYIYPKSCLGRTWTGLSIAWVFLVVKDTKTKTLSEWGYYSVPHHPRLLTSDSKLERKRGLDRSPPPPIRSSFRWCPFGDLPVDPDTLTLPILAHTPIDARLRYYLDPRQLPPPLLTGEDWVYDQLAVMQIFTSLFRTRPLIRPLSIERQRLLDHVVQREVELFNHRLQTCFVHHTWHWCVELLQDIRGHKLVIHFRSETELPDRVRAQAQAQHNSAKLWFRLPFELVMAHFPKHQVILDQGWGWVHTGYVPLLARHLYKPHLQKRLAEMQAEPEVEWDDSTIEQLEGGARLISRCRSLWNQVASHIDRGGGALSVITRPVLPVTVPPCVHNLLDAIHRPEANKQRPRYLNDRQRKLMYPTLLSVGVSPAQIQRGMEARAHALYSKDHSLCQRNINEVKNAVKYWARRSKPSCAPCTELINGQWCGYRDIEDTPARQQCVNTLKLSGSESAAFILSNPRQYVEKKRDQP